MANRYVDSTNGSPSSPYESKATAANSIDDVDGIVNAGELIYVSHTHSENFGTTKALNFAGGSLSAPVKIVSMNFSTDAYQAGAVIEASAGSFNTLSLDGNIHVNGVTFKADTEIQLGQANEWQRYVDCKFQTVRTSAAVTSLILFEFGLAYQGGARCDMIDCEFDWSSYASGSLDSLFELMNGLHVRIINPTLTGGSVTPTCLVKHTNDAGTYQFDNRFEFENADLSPMSTNPILGSHEVDAVFRNCNLASSYNMTTMTWSQPRGSILLENCGVGTLSNPPLGLTGFRDYRGTITADDTIFRNSGASDGSTPYSWKMVTNNVNGIYGPLESPPIAVWVGTGSQTLTVYFRSGGTKTDADVWVQVITPGEGGTPTAKGVWESTKAAPLASGTNLTTDGSSSWDPSDATMQKIDIAINPAVEGVAIVRVFFAATSSTLWVCPKLGIA